MTPVSIKRKHPNTLKRPDLQGEFKCGSCQEVFHHASSLNRHRLLLHSAEICCVLCDRHLTVAENVRDHMRSEHQSKSFTCSCCNWTFAEKRELLQHMQSMLEDGMPGEVTPIAISIHPPGSLKQETLLGRPEKEKKNKVVSRKRKTPMSEGALQSFEEMSLDTTLEQLLSLNREIFQQLIQEIREFDTKNKIPEVTKVKRARIAEIGDALAKRVGIIQ